MGPPSALAGASRIMKKYSRGKRHLKLSEVGISTLNRKVCGKYAHRLGKRIYLNGF